MCEHLYFLPKSHFYVPNFEEVEGASCFQIVHACLRPCELSPFLELCPFKKIRMKSCQKDISKSIWARDLKLGQLVEDDK